MHFYGTQVLWPDHCVQIEDATRGIDTGGSMARASQEMQGAGVARIQSADVGV